MNFSPSVISGVEWVRNVEKACFICTNRKALAVYSLTELNQHIRETIENEYPEALWIRAEIFAFQVNPMSGHCYMELTEGNARAKAMVWKKTYEILSRKFQIGTGMGLQKGMAVQFLAKVEYHIQYGLSLVVWDVDIEFSLGEKAKKRAEVVRKLEAEGLLRKNASLPLPDLIQHFAVISSATAAGFQDFIVHLKENPFGFAFGYQLFSAQMQGNEAIGAISQAFENIIASGIPFQAVVIIRGGGSAGDLQVFDEYEVAKCISECPIAVLTGIGHERDESVADQAAHSKFKTPTAVADFLIEKLMLADKSAGEQGMEICRRLQGQWQQQWTDYQNIIQECHLGFRKSLYNNERETGNLIQKTVLKLGEKFRSVKEEFQTQETRIFELNPLAILKKGYAMIDQSGNRIHQIQAINPDLPFSITMNDGKKEVKISGN